MDVAEYPFDEQYDNFAFNSLLTREEAIQAIGKVRTECNEVAAKSLFHIPTTKHMKLEEFEQTQSQATSQVGDFLITVICCSVDSLCALSQHYSHNICAFADFIVSRAIMFWFHEFRFL